jgi:cell division protein FtsW
MTKISKMANKIVLSDRIILLTTVFLIFCGMLGNISVSPAISAKLDVESYYFFKRYVLYISISFILMAFLVNMETPSIIRFCILVLGFSIICMMLVIVAGSEVKGAKRWLNLGIMKMQPSEFAKPTFLIINAVIMKNFFERKKYIAMISGGLLSFIILLLLLEPDVGMSMTFMAIYGMQMFLSGISMYIIIYILLLMIPMFAILYFVFPHVRYRFMNMFTSQENLNYQIKQALKAIQDGGFFGKGPGNGVVKYNLPDANCDYIFSAICEEFGIFIGILIVLSYLTIFIRCIQIGKKLKSNFEAKLIISLGFLIIFQAFVNIGVNLKILPSKGMALPMISYGGSSAIANAILIGVILSLSCRAKNISSPYMKFVKRGFGN